jgi:soluble lytic murein transglycosylase-like protein
MKTRTLLLSGVLAALASASAGEVRLKIEGGKRVIYNDGPARLGASETWLATRMQKTSGFDELIESSAREFSVDPKLVKSVMLVESGFNPSAISRKGARGLMQLMPDTAAEHGVDMSEIHDPRRNIAAGTRHLSRLLEYYGGDLVKSLAAYNAGERAVDRYGGVPPYDETQLYVRKTLAAYYGKSTLGGGFGKPTSETFRGIPSSEGKPVRWIRDERTNRVILTTKARPARAG